MYSQNNYKTMFYKEKAIGDYTKDQCNNLEINSEKRKQMVMLIESLHQIK